MSYFNYLKLWSRNFDFSRQLDELYHHMGKTTLSSGEAEKRRLMDKEIDFMVIILLILVINA